MIVRHFGIHWAEGGVPFLLEQSHSKTLWPYDVPCPFIVRPDRLTLRCPHALGSAEPMEGSAPSHLAPLVNGGAFFIQSISTHQLEAAHLLCGAVRPIAFAMWATSFRDLVDELNLTNIAPLILTGVQVRHYADLDRFLRIPRVRTLIVETEHPRRGLTPIELGPVTPHPDLTRIGGYILRSNQ